MNIDLDYDDRELLTELLSEYRSSILDGSISVTDRVGELEHVADLLTRIGG
jgi:hypothetical protein